MPSSQRYPFISENFKLKQRMRWSIVTVLLFLFACDSSLCDDVENYPGVVYLENLTFNKTLKKFPFAFVQFDDGTSVPSSKSKMLEFSRLSSDFLSHNSDILPARVRFTWGEVESKKMADRFQIFDDLALPEFILFSVDQSRSKSGSRLVANETRYGGDVNVKQLVDFLKGKTGKYIGRKGCLEKFDDLAGTFYRNSGGKDREKVIRETERLIGQLEKKKSPAWTWKSGKMYLKIMTAAGPNIQDYVSSEVKRMKKFLSEKDITEQKKKDFQIRLNILRSFS